MEKVLEYLNEGYEWVVDLDIEKYFDTVNHDKLISILRERVNDATKLHLIRSYLRAGVMENGLVSATEEGVPQGGPLSPILSNVYLDKFDKELESRGLRFVRYADDCNIFCEKRNGGKPGDGENKQLAGAQAAAESERKQDKSREADKQQISGIHILEIERRMEGETCGRSGCAEK